jgi:hypothetical protein
MSAELGFLSRVPWCHCFHIGVLETQQFCSRKMLLSRVPLERHRAECQIATAQSARLGGEVLSRAASQEPALPFSHLALCLQYHGGGFPQGRRE